MEATTVVRRLRTFLLALAGALCVGTVAELLLMDHTQEPTQWVPFALCGLGLAAVAAAALRPGRTTLLGLRAVMALLVAGSLFGVYEHLAANLLFELDLRPGAAWTDVALLALKGSAPLLAPGILALAGVLAIASTYAHPALDRASAVFPARSAPR